MPLARLSRIETVPSPSLPHTPNPSNRRPKLLNHIFTFTLLTISTVLIFLTLLLPNKSTHLSSFHIRPIDKVYTPTPLASGTTTQRPIATGIWGEDAVPTKRDLRLLDKDENEKEEVIWCGIDGPEIWVGPMRESTQGVG